MRYDDLIILIPSHSLEDFPTELGEKDAAGILNAFAVSWHPLLLAEAQAMPQWHRADEPPDELGDRLVFAPSACDDWLPGGWVEHARLQGAVVVAGTSDRAEMIEAAIAPLRPTDEETETDTPETDTESTPQRINGKFDVDPDLVADFLALGSCYLQVELLTRHMHHFSNLDEVHLQREAVAAAEAAIADDHEACRTHLRICFEALLEARERFYPVDCYLIDLCLLIPRLADQHLETTISNGRPISLLLSGQDLDEIAAAKPEIVESLRKAWDEGRVDVVGGELREAPTPLLPIESVLTEFRRGHRLFKQHLGRTPTTWGRRNYGFSTQIPQIITQFGYHSALHFALDDGIYPDAEQSKIRWEGCNGTSVDAISRIPLAGDSAVSFLRFAQRMAESMEEDQVASVIFARWPELTTPWNEDFRRIESYAPCLGRPVTLSGFFEQTDNPGRLSSYDAHEYLSPFLVQMVARGEENPIGRFVDFQQRRTRFDAARWYAAAARILCGQSPESADDIQRENCIEDAGSDSTTADVEKANALIDEFAPQAAQELADVITAGGEEADGFLVLNSLSFAREVSVELPGMEAAPQTDDLVKATQFDSERKFATVSLPPSGFAWIPAAASTAVESRRSSSATAEEHVLRNEFFEVHINEATGGIRTIKGYGRSPNRLSQLLAFRFPRERIIRSGDEDNVTEEKTYYSAMRCLSSKITCDGPSLGEIVTTGEIVDQQNDKRLAGYQQTFRVWRGRRIVEVDIELDVDRMPEGDPWTNYFAARFAWNDSAASLTRAVQLGAHGIQGERFESPHYLEIADETQRTTILNCGLPFHRTTGMRMVDSLLIAAGDTKRRFRFVIAVDADYPMQAALDAITPAAVVRTTRRPRSGSSGWFFRLNARNVQILHILDCGDATAGEAATYEQHDQPQAANGKGFALRLIETEGRSRKVKLTCFKTPVSARLRDFQGRPLNELTIEGDNVIIDMAGHEIADVELRF
jgi:alpha-mannosidase